MSKSIITLALSYSLSAAGQRVLTIDLDAQVNMSYTLGASDALPSSMEVLTQAASLRDTIQQTFGPDVIAGSPALYSADVRQFKNPELYIQYDVVDDKYDFWFSESPIVSFLGGVGVIHYYPVSEFLHPMVSAFQEQPILFIANFLFFLNYGIRYTHCAKKASAVLSMISLCKEVARPWVVLRSSVNTSETNYFRRYSIGWAASRRKRRYYPDRCPRELRLFLDSFAT